MWRRARQYPIVVSLAALALLTIAGVAASGWYFLSEARRAGRLVATMLTAQTGVPFVVDRATTDGSQRLILQGLRIPPGPHWRGEVHVRELRVDGGLLPIVFPRGRSVSVVAVSASVILPPPGSMMSPPTTTSLASLRQFVVAMVSWPAEFSVNVQGGELRSGDDVFAFDLNGRKSGAGTLTATATITPATSGALALSKNESALALELAGGQAGGRVHLQVHLVGAPGRLRSLWPAALPALARVVADAELALPPEPTALGTASSGDPDLTLAGRVEAVRAPGVAAITAEFTSRYHAEAGRLEVSRLSVRWGPYLNLMGAGRVEQLGAGAVPGGGAAPGRPPHVTLEMSGEATGTTLTGDLAYAAGSGDFTARIQTEALDAVRLVGAARRLLGDRHQDRREAGRFPIGLVARRSTSTVTGTAGRSEIRFAVQSALDGLEARAVFPNALLAGALGAGGVLRRTDRGLDLARLDRSTLTLSRSGAPLAVITARSRDRAAWPVVIEAAVAELDRMPSSPLLPGKYSGWATITGIVDRGREGLQFVGQLTAEVPSAEIDLGGPVVLTNIKADVPAAWGGVVGPGRRDGAADARVGRVSVERITGYGFTVDRFLSPAQFRDGRLLLSAIDYVHYGGRGTGWLEAVIDGRAIPLRARLDGQHIDLARLTREYGLTIAEVSGIVHYLFVLQYSAAQGIVGVGQVQSDDEGGEVSIQAIERLLASAEVEAESTGVLRQTLENLRVFRYASLSGDVRITRSGGYVNLSLEGKKRLGIFPAPVKAINLRNVPIGLLARLFARRTAS
jgi:hypothetical protein